MMKYLVMAMAISLMALGTSCKMKSEYQKRVETELAKGERHDTLFLGMYFGMARDSFFKHCMFLNHQELVKQGITGISVSYTLRGADTLRFPTYMDFYPNFDRDKNKISEMDMNFSYLSWAPWIPATSSDSLALDVVKLFERWYGPGFVKEKSPQKGLSYYVKIDGNRQILVSRADDIKVTAIITDLSALPVKF